MADPRPVLHSALPLASAGTCLLALLVGSAGRLDAQTASAQVRATVRACPVRNSHCRVSAADVVQREVIAAFGVTMHPERAGMPHGADRTLFMPLSIEVSAAGGTGAFSRRSMPLPAVPFAAPFTDGSAAAPARVAAGSAGWRTHTTWLAEYLALHRSASAPSIVTITIEY